MLRSILVALDAILASSAAQQRPQKLIEMESVRHHLLVMGEDADFHVDFAGTTSDTVQRL